MSSAPGAADIDQNVAGFSELDSVASEIGQNLSQANGISNEAARYRWRIAENEFQAFFFRARGEKCADLFHYTLKIEGHFFEFQFSRFDFGKIQNVIQDR